MKPILSSSARPVLERLAEARPLLGFDFDGVLAPMVADPARAQLRPPTRRLLQQLVRLYSCVVISGRSRRDVLGRLSGIRLRVIGNHGAEPGPGAASLRKAVRGWLPLLAPLGRMRGIVIEDKGLSMAIHYRHATHKRIARDTILDCSAKLQGVRIIGGKDVVNLIPLNAPSKGDALERELRRARRGSAIFVGDDETDEDAFALAANGRLLAIRVGRKRHSLATHYLRNQGEIDALLRLLISEMGTMPSHG